MRFQERDGRILWAILSHAGMLAFRHLKHMFWPDATERAALKRLAKLIENDYLAKPTREQRRTQPVSETVYWLNWRGMLWIASQQGITIDPPTNKSENQMRKLAGQLRANGIHWLRQPRWIQLSHDLAIVDFRLVVLQAVKELHSCSLETWVHESEFRSCGDTVTYQARGRDGRLKQMKKRVYPDSYFVILDEQRLARGLLARARFMLELDNATHTNSRFGRDKVAPGLAYIKSPLYRARFGDNSGRWLVVTTGKTRMRNLMRQTQQVAGTGAAVFLFTTFDQLKLGNILTDPVWRQPGKRDPLSLLT